MLGMYVLLYCKRPHGDHFAGPDPGQNGGYGADRRGRYEDHQRYFPYDQGAFDHRYPRDRDMTLSEALNINWSADYDRAPGGQIVPFPQQAQNYVSQSRAYPYHYQRQPIFGQSRQYEFPTRFVATLNER